jgi:hypothetical protein
MYLNLSGESKQRLEYLTGLFKRNDWLYSQETKKLFYFDATKYLADHVQDFVVEFDKVATAWEHQMRVALNKKIPPALLTSKKATPLGRYFPYKRQGHMRDSVMADVSYLGKSNSGKTLRVEGVFDVFQASSRMTNEGIPERKDGKTGTWAGWLDDMFQGNGRGRFISAKQMFEGLLDIRRNVPRG